jgi:thiamine pyrophosphate-dependent acetolactate synthase large subunit-like protein
VDIAGVAAAAGFPLVVRLETDAQIDCAVDSILHAAGPVLVNVKISDAPVPQMEKERDAVLMKHRFRESLKP